jgi:serine/threonine protein kinase
MPGSEPDQPPAQSPQHISVNSTDTPGPPDAALQTLATGAGTSSPPPLGRVHVYELLAKLGEGGMGEVYKARHTRLDKLFALKLLSEKLADSPGLRERFRREVQAAGKLNHPNIVQATDAGDVEGRPFLAMELLDGIDLGRLIKERGPLPLADACDAVRQAALGLEHAHQAGLVHRDIKPSNLMRTMDGTVKILDLGLARIRGGAENLELTVPGQTLGTADYMAPEQAVDGSAVDIRADIYSLGCTLYHLLAGGPPFAGPRWRTRDAKIQAHLNQPPPDIRLKRPELPATLANLVTRMLAKKVDQRPRTPADVAEELAEFAGQAEATPDTLVDPRPLPYRQRRRWLIVGAGVLLFAALAAGLMLSGIGHMSGRDKGELPLSNSSPGPTSPSVSEPLRVQKIDVHLFARSGEQAEPRGLIGNDTFAARLRDQVTVEARLSHAAYAYLIAFRPDGIKELCYPDREDIPPPLTERPHYPSEGSDVRYGLSDGAGLMVFAVLASDRPLPSYHKWLQGRSLAWQSAAGQPSEEVFWSDGQVVDVLQPNDRLSNSRGKGEAALPVAPAFKKLADSLQVDSSNNAIGLLGFTVFTGQKP